MHPSLRKKEGGDFCCFCHSLGDAVCMSVLTLAARAVEARVTDTGEMPRTTVYTGTAVETRVAGTSAACNDNGSEGRSSNTWIGMVYTPISNTSDCRLSFISRLTVTRDRFAVSKKYKTGTHNNHALTQGLILTDFTARTSEFRAARAREVTVVVDTGGAVKTRSTGTSVENCDIRHETYVTG